jgi:hypothetical protein
MSPQRARMIEDMILAGFARGTQKLYVQAVRRLTAHYAARLISSAKKRCGPPCSTCASEGWRAASIRPTSNSSAATKATPCSTSIWSSARGQKGC